MSSALTEEMLAQLENAKKVLPTNAAFQEWLKIFRRVEYSMNNKMMIYIQNPNATQTYGFHTRRSMKRQVKLWEEALHVFAMKKTEYKDEKTGEIVEKKYFGTKAVFDISQTEPLTLNK